MAIRIPIGNDTIRKYQVTPGLISMPATQPTATVTRRIASMIQGTLGSALRVIWKTSQTW